MITTPTLGRFICRLLIGVLVSTQVAIAAYACAGMPGMVKVTNIGSQDMGMGADGMDPDLTNLCVGHCQYGNQTADKKPAPDVPVALLASLYVLPSVDRDADAVGPLVPRARLAAPDPPHTILHCCLRD